jgi:hypothetical protein
MMDLAATLLYTMIQMTVVSAMSATTQNLMDRQHVARVFPVKYLALEQIPVALVHLVISVQMVA